MKTNKILIGILLLSFFLNTFHINWGLPALWHPDEKGWVILKMAKNMDPNPHFFNNPSFHLYVLVISLMPYFIYLKIFNLIPANINHIKNIYQVPSFMLNDIYIITRAVSAIASVFTVFIVYLIASEIRNKKAGLISAFLLTITMGFVNISHFATPESLFMFLISLSLLFMIKAIKYSRKHRYIFIASFFAGLALSTKYTAIILIIPLLTAYLIRQDRKHIMHSLFIKDLILVALIFSFGFILGTPYSVLSLNEFISEMQRDFGYISHGYRPEFSNPNGSWLLYIPILNNIYGLPFFIFNMGAFLYVIYLYKKLRDPSLLVLLIFSITFFLFVGSWRYENLRFILPMIVATSIFSGIFFERIIRRGIKNIASLLLITMIAYTFIYTAVADLMFLNDSRYPARQWIEKNIPFNSTIGVYTGRTYLPDIFEDFNVTIYNVTLHKSRDDYIILTNFYYERFLQFPNAYPKVYHYYDDILSGKNTKYLLIRHFCFEVPFINPKPEFVNPKISIFKHISYS